MFDFMRDFNTNRLVQLCVEGFEHPLACFYPLISNLDEGWERFTKQKLTVKSIFTTFIHTIQQFESISHINFTPAMVSRLTSLKVTLIPASFSLHTWDFILTWTIFIKQLKFNPGRKILGPYVLFLSSFSAVFHIANVSYFTPNSSTKAHQPWLTPFLEIIKPIKY